MAKAQPEIVGEDTSLDARRFPSACLPLCQAHADPAQREDRHDETRERNDGVGPAPADPQRGDDMLPHVPDKQRPVEAEHQAEEEDQHVRSGVRVLLV